ncbi:TetR/AcrR family transcriptional regulator [Amycolatopsis azurea]|uniref:TetR family transcriptional regulator n=1 Tax=Amycolatopsis azurea DSM 43854 TaxID=1238180 RepID=M2QTR8_9PSEU|nr:TetR/AcrR family transcriptional regulator [Amycolatopsis azurea]EMD29402.1 Transcriptional regulator, TetR family [Amycolatopsis azurea DSM 43854]OOC02814.1 TetR family transcriptional regulator [Amycolatopsis azurea DSM 43854]
MAAETRTPPSAWIDAGLLALAAGGPGAVRVEALAKALGVTKGSFYGHFSDRGALLEEMLATWERLSTGELIASVEHGGGDARAKIRRAGILTGDRVLSVDLAIRDWSRRDPEVAERLRRVDNQLMDYLRSLMREIFTDDDEVEARCLLAFSLLVGKHFMAADHGGRSRDEVTELAGSLILGGGHGRDG